MKRCICLLLSLILLLGLGVQTLAAPPRLVDNAGYLSDDQREQLSDRIDSLVDTYHIDIIILTISTLDHYTSSDYADQYFDNNGYGIGPDHSGILLLISEERQDWAVSTCGAGMDALPDKRIDQLMDPVVDHLAQGEYFSAFHVYLDELEVYLKMYQDGITHTIEEVLTNLLVALLIGAVVALIVLLILRHTMNTARRQTNAGQYVQHGSFNLYRRQDIFLYSKTTRTRRSSSSGSGGHRSSSGRSHGGQSGKF